MSRMHIGIGVNDLDQAIPFYSQLFDHEPTMKKKDYAQWILNNPSINFSITKNCCDKPGIGHLGIQVDTNEEYTEISNRLKKITADVRTEEETTCCYARSQKEWIADPAGVDWEIFLTHNRTDEF